MIKAGKTKRILKIKNNFKIIKKREALPRKHSMRKTLNKNIWPESTLWHSQQMLEASDLV